MVNIELCCFAKYLVKYFFIGSIPGTEKNRKRDVRDYYSSRDERNDVRTTGNLARRGDIPIIHGDCDGNQII